MLGIKIKQCPFCGGAAHVCKKGTRYGVIAFVECDVCKAKSGADKCFEDAESDEWNDCSIINVIARWNNRTQEADYE